jgi:hypothetical protein
MLFLQPEGPQDGLHTACRSSVPHSRSPFMERLTFVEFTELFLSIPLS